MPELQIAHDNKVSILESEVRNLKGTQKALQDQISKKNEEVESLNNELKNLKINLSSEKKQSNKATESNKVKELAQTLEDKSTQLIDVTVKNQEFARFLNEEKQTSTQLKKEKTDLENHVKGLEDDVKNLNKTLKNMEMAQSLTNSQSSTKKEGKKEKEWNEGIFRKDQPTQQWVYKTSWAIFWGETSERKGY